MSQHGTLHREPDRLVVEVFNAHGRTRLQRHFFVDDVTRVLIDAGINRGVVRVLFLDEKEHRAMNVEFLGHDFDTDVITFPLEEDPIEGEIYVNIEQGRRQAREHKVPFYHEWRRLAIHGALHLAGYLDSTVEEKRVMRDLENHYLGPSS